MAQYRTVEAVAYVHDGNVVSVAANRVIELDEVQAEALGEKVVRAREEDSMFPGGAPIIPAGLPTDVAPVEVDPRSLVSELPKPAPSKKPSNTN